MGKYLDIDDVVAGHPEAERQLAAMRDNFAEMQRKNERLRSALISMRPMLDKKRIAWKRHSDYLDSVLASNKQ